MILSIDEKPDLIIQNENIKYNDFLYSIYMQDDMLMHPQRIETEYDLRFIVKGNKLYGYGENGKIRTVGYAKRNGEIFIQNF